ncbi:MAG: hypothetical protein U9Q83_06615 [Bacteroidota bacterium]|nr:hypothetical protein [Bacteroidota bacterium]
MKKKWFWIGLIIIVALIIIGILYNQGIIKTDWQWLTIILAGIAAPISVISKWISGDNNRVQNILKDQTARRQQEQAHRLAYDNAVIQKEEKIKKLEAEINILEEKVDKLELQQEEVKEDVNQMTDINDLQDAFMEAYGDEK